jgi:hypothetical protein
MVAERVQSVEASRRVSGRRSISSGEEDLGGRPLLLVHTDGGSPVAALWVAQADSSRPQGRPDGAAVDAESGTDPGHRPSLGVQVNGVSDLFGVQSLAAHDDALAVQVRRDGDAVNAETGGQLVDGRPGAVTVDSAATPEVDSLVTSDRRRRGAPP